MALARQGKDARILLMPEASRLAVRLVKSE
jgi:hypothetical protein